MKLARAERAAAESLAEGPGPRPLPLLVDPSEPEPRRAFVARTAAAECEPEGWERACDFDLTPPAVAGGARRRLS